MRLSESEAVVESLLFIAGDAVPLGSIAQAIALDKATTRAVILGLAEKYERERRGLRIVEIEESYQMCTAAECFAYIRNMYQSPKRQGLSQALLETLAVVAYKQPVSRTQIEEIRGVNSDRALHKLLEKRLVCEVGKADTPGKPALFGTTQDFLRYFGFKNIGELPPLEEESIADAPATV